jgi:hypothetical protein
MQDRKEPGWGNATETELAIEHDEIMTSDELPEEVDGWQQYRKWISTAPAPKKRRSGIDPSLYTWKGYRNWTEQVKRKWSDS